MGWLVPMRVEWLDGSSRRVNGIGRADRPTDRRPRGVTITAPRPNNHHKYASYPLLAVRLDGDVLVDERLERARRHRVAGVVAHLRLH